MTIYLDNAATTPVAPEVLAAMMPYFGNFFGNPSSLHSFGQEAKRGIETARSRVAALIGAAPEEIVFTSGGTESDNFAVKGVADALKGKGNHIITTSIEHHAVLEPCHFLERLGFKTTVIGVDGSGMADPDDIRRAITPGTILISVMHANNEIGTVQSLAEIGAVAKENGILFHTDAVQTFGHVPVDVNELNVDLLSASAHKLRGPKGSGMLYMRKGTGITSFMHGGRQEKGRRASTENVAGIVGLGKAAEVAGREMEQEITCFTAMRDRFIGEVLGGIPGVRLNGHPGKRLPNNINISIDNVEGEALVLALDMEGIACSTGSACTSSSMEPSHVLRAVGLSREQAQGSLRLTLGRQNTEQELEYAVKVLEHIVTRMRK